MPISAPSAPPRKGTASTSGARPQPVVSVTKTPLSPKARARAEGVGAFMGLASLGLIARNQLADAGALAKHGESVATELARTADDVEPLGRVLDIMAMSGPYAALFGAILPLAVQIAINHNVMQAVPGIEGIVPKQALEAEVSAGIAMAQLDAMHSQQEAEKKLAEAKALMNGEASP